ncbi:FAD-dependent monooxygenase [uncultured Cellulomonas sp.]|uniref:FAD-dependent monooxygenase n=1 Tax=uncultured Cellulomonas sp. TaxID=189682 RepID=UPI0026199B7A|nr:FAD-dependent monooxygenase [uncultured Cellulomonas sp.]
MREVPAPGGRPPRVLICGAGIAGSALACLLTRGGHEVTVVERHGSARSSGNPVDVRGAAYDVVQRLGLLAPLEDVATRVREVVFVDTVGRPVARMPTRRGDRELEVSRADLCGLLLERARGDADVRFDETVTGLHADDDGVDVSFARGRPERFDVVVAADGLHSTVRRLAFGPEDAFVTSLGLVVATVRLPGVLDGDEDVVVMHNRPGAAVALHPGAGTPGAAFMFRTPARVDPRDADAADRLLTEVYAPMGWRVPELLAGFLAADDRYLDTVSRVRVPRWSRGRVVLLGDAASCVSLFGDGSSAAIAGAAALARSLVQAPDDTAGALRRYQSLQEPLTRRGQRGAAVVAHLLVPATGTGIALRDRALRLAGRRPAATGPG